MGKEEIRWQAAPTPRKHVPIMTVRVGVPLTVVTSGTLLGAYAHFFEGRSYPCWPADAQPCQFCKTQKARWKGFLPVRLASGAKRIVEVTEGAYLPLIEITGFKELGVWLLFRRSGKAPNSPLMVERVSYRDPIPGIQPFDAELSVLHMWGLDRLLPNAEHCNEG